MYLLSDLWEKSHLRAQHDICWWSEPDAGWSSRHKRVPLLALQMLCCVEQSLGHLALSICSWQGSWPLKEGWFKLNLIFFFFSYFGCLLFCWCLWRIQNASYKLLFLNTFLFGIWFRQAPCKVDILILL